MRPNPDRVTIEMIKDRLESITDQMGITLVKNARSYTLNESHDCATAIFDFEGRMVAQSPLNLSHLLGIKLSVERMLKQFDSDLHDQDVIIVNDPYSGGTHLPAMTMMKRFTNRRARETWLTSQEGNILFRRGKITHGLWNEITASEGYEDVLARFLYEAQAPYPTTVHETPICLALSISTSWYLQSISSKSSR